MQFVCIGPHQGKTVKLGNVQFTNGLANVDPKAEGLHNLLMQYNSAYPAHMIEEGDGGVLRVKPVEDKEHKLDFTPRQLSSAEVRTALAVTAPPVDLNALTKVELQQRASDAGLETTGSKADLVARLTEHNEG